MIVRMIFTCMFNITCMNLLHVTDGPPTLDLKLSHMFMKVNSLIYTGRACKHAHHLLTYCMYVASYMDQ